MNFLPNKRKCIIKTALISAVSTILVCTLVHSFTMSDIEKLSFLIQTKYAGDSAPDALLTGAADGMLSTLGDPHSVYMTEEEYQSFLENLEALYIGIGIEIKMLDGKMHVIAPFPDSPADAAGIRSGDIIQKVDDIVVTADTYEAAISHMREKDETPLSVTILRGNEEKTLSIKRDTIQIQTVSHVRYDDVFYIALKSFDTPTATAMREALKIAEEENCRSIILDVRDNPGGLLESVTEIADMLLPACTVVYTENKDKKRDFVYESDDAFLDKPLILLVNENSASASEILAGTLKDNGRATLVGTKTYGKGSVQNLYKLREGAVKLTIAHYYTPGGYIIDKNGITPDYIVENTGDDDAQFKKALELARQ